MPDSMMKVAETITNIDCDTHDPEWAIKVAKDLGLKPHDQTSNQIAFYLWLVEPAQKEIVRQCVKEYYCKGWEKTIDRITAIFSKANIKNISGRVLAQVSPRYINSVQGTLERARSYAEEFEKVGITRDRFAIKIMISGSTACASKILNDEGIRTLGTTIFCSAQALAASQARTLYISPYYNDSRHHSDIASWPNKDDPALEHPMSPRVYQYQAMYKKLYKETGKEQPLIKLGGFIGPKEVIAAGELGCHSSTIVGRVLGELIDTRATYIPKNTKKMGNSYADAPEPAERLSKLASSDSFIPNWDGKFSTNVDMLANEGVALNEAIAADPVASVRMPLSINRFTEFEMKSKDYIDAIAKELVL